ncbi:uncharacterized protein LOC144627665 isoform X2 [Crassostrea virginica]
MASNNIPSTSTSEERSTYQKDLYEVCIQDPTSVKEGETVKLNATVKFRSSIKYLIWQKSYERKYIDIDTQGPKYFGSKNDFENTSLEIHDFNVDDEANYRLKIVTNQNESVYAYLPRLKMLRTCISEVCIQDPTSVKEGETVKLNATVKFRSSIKYLIWQKSYERKYIDIDTQGPKYFGSKNDFENTSLEIHDFNVDDEANYRLKIVTNQNVSVYAYVPRLKMLRTCISDLPSINIPENQRLEIYNVGENIEVKMDVKNPATILCATWQRTTTNGSETINIMQPKYKGTKNTKDEYVLCINDCDEMDRYMGPYFLSVMCTGGREIISDKIDFRIVKEYLKVSFRSVPKAKQMKQGCLKDDFIYERKVIYGEYLELRAAIKSLPTTLPIVWMKDSVTLDLREQKYIGSSCNCDQPVLCIKKVTEEDEGFYRIAALNNFEGKYVSDTLKITVNGAVPKVQLRISAQSQPVTLGSAMLLIAEIESCPLPTSFHWEKDKDTLRDFKKVIKGDDKLELTVNIQDMKFEDSGTYRITVTNALGTAYDAIHINVAVNKVFISGPVVVSTPGYIQFKAIYRKESQSLQAKWIKTKDEKSTEINLLEQGYSVLNSGSGVLQIQSVNIPSVPENFGTYQLYLKDDMKSNKITVIEYDSDTYSTESKQNCLRLFALQTVSKQALGMKLNEKIDNFNTSWMAFEGHCRKKKITAILPKTTPSSFEDLDVSVMCAMFQYLYEKSPTKGWENDPGDDDKEIADDVKRIRMCRNKISHVASTQMTTEDFNDSVINLIGRVPEVMALRKEYP